jgi:hypothetical protein
VFVENFFFIVGLFKLLNRFSSANGRVVDLTIVRKISRPGEVYWEGNATLFNFFNRPYTGRATTYSTITYTDYTNVQVRFICRELRHFWYTEAEIAYYISVKDRSFDSVAQIAPHLERFAALGGDLNRIIFFKNDLSCTN